MGVRDTSLPQPPTFFQLYERRAIRQLGCQWPIQVAWSADGARLAYVCDLAGRHAHSRIYVIDANGSGRRAVSTGVRTPGFPSWSPDGTRIAFATGSGPASNPAEHSSVYAVELDGSGRRLVARHGTAPAWSPDGQTIAYRSTCGVRLVTPDGKDATPSMMRARCTEMRSPGFPAWSWDGTRLAFGMTSRPWRGLYVLNADGTGLTRVSTQPGIGVFGTGRPAWTPTPRVVPAPKLPPRRSRCC
jgi:TolB protein